MTPPKSKKPVVSDFPFALVFLFSVIFITCFCAAYATLISPYSNQQNKNFDEAHLILNQMATEFHNTVG